MKHDEDFWAITSLHESAHGMVAFALGCHPVELRLDRRHESHGSTMAGVCRASYEKTWYGKVAKLLVTNAPFAAHQIECLPCGDVGDLHERDDCQRSFAEVVGVWDAELYSKCVDEPLLTFFGNSDVQASVILMAKALHRKNSLALKNVKHWTRELAIPEYPCELLRASCLEIAKALHG